MSAHVNIPNPLYVIALLWRAFWGLAAFLGAVVVAIFGLFWCVVLMLLVAMRFTWLLAGWLAGYFLRRPNR